MFKIVDGSSRLGVNSSDVIDTKEKLFEVIRTHLERLFEGKSEDEKLFWATYSYYRINEDQIILCSKFKSVYYPIFDVSVEKSDETSIKAIPYKIDYVEEFPINRLDVITPKENTISPLEVLGWEENLEQKWKGQIWIRSGFTGWNAINVSVDMDF